MGPLLTSLLAPGLFICSLLESSVQRERIDYSAAGMVISSKSLDELREAAGHGEDGLQLKQLEVMLLQVMVLIQTIFRL